MEKAKLGIAYNVLAAIVCLLGYYGGYVITGIFTIAVLFTEENPWLKKYCVKTLLLMLVFSLLYTVLGLIPDILGIVRLQSVLWCCRKRIQHAASDR